MLNIGDWVIFTSYENDTQGKYGKLLPETLVQIRDVHIIHGYSILCADNKVWWISKECFKPSNYNSHKYTQQKRLEIILNAKVKL